MNLAACYLFLAMKVATSDAWKKIYVIFLSFIDLDLILEVFDDTLELSWLDYIRLVLNTSRTQS